MRFVSLDEVSKSEGCRCRSLATATGGIEGDARVCAFDDAGMEREVLSVLLGLFLDGAELGLVAQLLHEMSELLLLGAKDEQSDLP